MFPRQFFSSLLGIFSLASAPFAVAENSEPSADSTPRAARSVHLQWDTNGGAEAFCSRVVVLESTPGSYFCTMGFHRGYGGIQHLINGKHAAIFSVWDPGNAFDFSANPNETEESIRTQVLYLHPSAPEARFGGEGTGARCLFEFDWEENHEIYFLLQNLPLENKRMAYRAWIRNGTEGEWELMAVYISQQDEGSMRRFYSFVEDFHRNGESPYQCRVADFGPTWVYQGEQWHTVSQAQFTGDSNPLENVNAGIGANGSLFLGTGGDISQLDSKLFERLEVEEEVAPTTAEQEEMNALLQSPWPEGVE